MSMKICSAREATGSFITFVDSRKGVEILAKRAGGMKDEKDALITAEVLPYRAGFESGRPPGD